MLISEKVKRLVQENGFAELVATEKADDTYRWPSKGCSFGYFSSKCSLTGVFAGTDEAWARFLQLEGGRLEGTQEQIVNLPLSGMCTNFPGVKGTASGAYNAVTEYLDHFTTSKGSKKGASVMKTLIGVLTALILMFSITGADATEVYSSKLYPAFGGGQMNCKLALSNKTSVAPNVYEYKARFGPDEIKFMSNSMKVLVNCNTGLYKVSVQVKNNTNLDAYGNRKGGEWTWADLGWEGQAIDEWPNYRVTKTQVCGK